MRQTVFKIRFFIEQMVASKILRWFASTGNESKRKVRDGSKMKIEKRKKGSECQNVVFTVLCSF